MRDHLEHVARRVIAPDAAVDLDASPAITFETPPGLVDASLAFGLPDLRAGRVSRGRRASRRVPMRLLSVSWRSWMPQPVSRTSMSAMSALSSLFLSGTNSRLGGAPRNRPPKPTAIGVANAFEEHLPAVGDTVVIGVLEDQDPAVAGSRGLRPVTRSRGSRRSQPPRSSQQKAIGCVIIGSFAHALTVAVQRRHLRDRLLGREQPGLAPFALRDTPQHVVALPGYSATPRSCRCR